MASLHFQIVDRLMMLSKTWMEKYDSCSVFVNQKKQNLRVFTAIVLFYLCIMMFWSIYIVDGTELVIRVLVGV